MGQQWSSSQEEEDFYRRRLFTRANRGDAKAQQELQTTYGVRLWLAKERSELVYDNPQSKSRVRRAR